MNSIKISKRANETQASPIRRLIPHADAAKKRGIQIYHLNIGQPDIPTPEPMMKAYQNYSGPVLEYGPSQGLHSYLEKLSVYYKKHGINAEKTDIMITTAGSEAIIFAMMAIADVGDEIIVPEPFYTNYNGFASMAGVKLVPVTTLPENGFRLPPKTDFTSRITDKTKAIMICNPGNPTGVVYNQNEMEMLREIVLEHNLYFISDEVYREFVFDDEKAISVFHLEGIDDRAIIVDSISKRFSACGARIGNIVCRNKEVMAAALKFGQARLCPPTLEQLAAEAALSLPESYFEDMRLEYLKRRDTVMEILEKIDGVICRMPKGAFYVIAKLPVENAEEFVIYMLDEFNLDGETVMVSPANGFYATPGLGESEIRIAFVLESEKLRRSMEIFKSGLEAFIKRKN